MGQHFTVEDILGESFTLLARWKKSSDKGNRRILFFPYGNQVEYASLYLDHAWEKEPPENWYACVQFALVLWNPNDPAAYVSHGK